MCPPSTFKRVETLDHLIKMDDLNKQLADLHLDIKTHLLHIENLRNEIYSVEYARHNLLQANTSSDILARENKIRANQRALRKEQLALKKERRNFGVSNLLQPYLSYWLELKKGALESEQRVLREKRKDLVIEREAFVGTVRALVMQSNRLREEWVPALHRLMELRHKENELSSQYRNESNDYQTLIELVEQAR